MTEVDIHCNVLKCRKSLTLETQACVTSCSHIFCVDCSNSLFSKALSCPACNANLSNNDDINLTQLNPTEEYKSSILAGLKPDIILDISMRAISFYEYQTSQELLYKSMIQKSIENKYHTLRDKFEITTRDLNHVINAEKKKQIALVKEFELEKLKSQQILGKLEEKSKQFQKLQSMYEKLKRKALTTNIQEAFACVQPSSQHMLTYHQTNSLSRIDNQSIEPLRKGIIYDKDSISRLGRQSAITTDAKTIFHSLNQNKTVDNNTTTMSPPSTTTHKIYPVRHYENMKNKQEQSINDDINSIHPTNYHHSRHKYKAHYPINNNH